MDSEKSILDFDLFYFGGNMTNQDSTSRTNNTFNEDKKFYKLRLHQLFKDYLTNDTKLDPIIKVELDNIVEFCIDRFKDNDKNDLLQREYDELDLHDSKDETQNIREDTIENATKMLYSEKEEKKRTLDNFVVVKSAKEENAPMITYEREYNLKHKRFKKRGLKKKNSTDLYNDKKNKNKKKSEIKNKK